MDFYAHSGKHTDKSDWQTLPEHLNGVGQAAAARASFFGAHVLAQASGQLHDLGKYTHRFQERLLGEVPKVDHATWGAWTALQHYSGAQTGLAHLIAYGIAGHHAGLANGLDNQPGLTRSPLQVRLSADYRSTLPPLEQQWQQEISLPPKLCLPEGFTRNPTRGAFQLAMLARMVFSCLVDADFVDTDNYYRQLEGKPSRLENAGPTLEALREKLNQRLSGFKANSEVNRIRADVLSHVRAQADLALGLFSLTVPTGGGKTLASLAFALDHAITHGLRRVIYVIPFTSIVEQTAQVFRDAFGELGQEDVVLEHHSAFQEPSPRSSEAAADAKDGIDKRRLAMENWDAPIVVTTAVQFFESLYADRPSRCRKLHNIAASVVILDEAQTLPLNLLRPCVTVLDELAQNYRSSIVLCTATQPALRRDQGFTDGLDGVRELAPEPPRLYEQLRRVRARHVGKLSDEAIAGELKARDQVLCIVNNRRHARALFDAIADEPGARHLTTMMYARHRSAVLSDIRQQLKAGEPCRLASSSLVEAGVDLDFPAVLRAEAGLDSIAQAAGRCNREGRRDLENSEVLVFSAPDWKPPRELEQHAAVFRAIEPAHRDDLLSLTAVDAYFRELYARLGDARLDHEDLLGLLQGAGPSSLPLETLAAKFRIIQTHMRPIIIPFDHVTGQRIPEVDDALKRLEYAPGAARALQPFLVQVSQADYDKLWHAHAIEPVAPHRYADQFVQLVNPRLYDARFGLHVDQPQLLPVTMTVN